MEQFTKSRFWRTVAVALVLLLALDVGAHLFPAGTGMPEMMPRALAQGGGIVHITDLGIVTTNQDGNVVYRWGRIEGSPAGMTVVKFDLNSLSIDRLDLK